MHTGLGEYIFMNGSKYFGEFFDKYVLITPCRACMLTVYVSFRNGRGKYVYGMSSAHFASSSRNQSDAASGNSYIGEWKNGVKDGMC